MTVKRTPIKALINYDGGAKSNSSLSKQETRFKNGLLRLKAEKLEGTAKKDALLALYRTIVRETLAEQAAHHGTPGAEEALTAEGTIEHFMSRRSSRDRVPLADTLSEIMELTGSDLDDAIRDTFLAVQVQTASLINDCDREAARACMFKTPFKVDNQRHFGEALSKE